MKRFLIIISMIALTVMSYGAKWDVLRAPCRAAHKNHVESYDGFVYSTVTTEPFKLSGEYIIKSSNDKFIEVYSADSTTWFGKYEPITTDISMYELGQLNYKYSNNGSRIVFNPKTSDYQIPKEIYDYYVLGDNCYRSGFAFLPIGVALSIIGGAIHKQHPTGAKVLGSFGGTFVSLSIPLICGGSHIRRECNVDYRIYQLTK